MPAPGEVVKMQRFPIYYEGVGEFKDSNGVPSGARGAEALVEIGLNNRPHELVGVRVVNVYDTVSLFEQIEFPIPGVDPPVIERKNIPVAGFNLPVGDACCLLERLDGDQLMNVELAQQNVVVRDLHQKTMTGRAGVHWHPFPCAYPFRGGNNVDLRFRRLTAYPINAAGQTPEEQNIIVPVVHVTVLGWVWVSDEGVEPQPPGPPSTGFPQTRVATSV